VNWKQERSEKVATLEIHVAEPPPLRVHENGTVYVGQTRVPIDTVIWEYWNGATVEQILCNYDTLRASDVYFTIGYYLRHREEVDAYLEQRQQEAEELRRENERRFPSDGLRERLLARRAEMRERTQLAS